MSEINPNSPLPVTKKIMVPDQLDVSLAGSNDERAQIILDRLRKRRKYKEDNLYTGIDGSRLETIQRYGAVFSSRETIFCSREEQLFGGGVTEGITEGNAISYAETYEVPAIVVYKGDKLTEINGLDEYRFNTGVKPKDALIAIFIFKY